MEHMRRWSDKYLASTQSIIKEFLKYENFCLFIHQQTERRKITKDN